MTDSNYINKRNQDSGNIEKRISNKQLKNFEQICRQTAVITGIPVTCINRRGKIVFRTAGLQTEEVEMELNKLKKWFYRQLRKLTGQSKPQAPGPVLFALETDRVWAAMSLKSSVWSQDLLLIGSARSEQAEGKLQSLAELISLCLHHESAKVTSWLNAASRPGMPQLRNLRNSKRAKLPSQDLEYQYLLAIKTGDQKKLAAANDEFAANWRRYAERPIRYQKNSALLLAQQAISTAIEAALDSETANGIMDDFLRTIETCDNSEEVLKWISELFQELTTLTSEQFNQAWSQPVRLCQHYISRRVYSKITLEDLAVYTGHNPSYLSRHFKDETGEALTEYITRKKIEAACELLTEYKKPIQDVAIMLAFSDQAHFTRAFKRYTGTTPLKYSKKDQPVAEASVKS
ncbi:MAG: hypothetical protein PWP10_3596 [Clostridiales bacterium]|nr:hypothetical protein [Clostridiales bacterium]